RPVVRPDALGLIDRGQKRAAVVLRAAKRAWWGEGNEAGQILVFRAEPVNGPRSKGWPDKLETAGVHLQEGLRMARQVGLHAAHEAHLVGMFRDIRKEFRNPQAAVAALRELPFRS